MSAGRQRVVVLGASDKPERYSHQAVRLLLEHGHEVVPVHPREKVVAGLAVVPDLAHVTGPVDTLTLYVGAAISSSLQPQIVALRPARVIFNPGAENPDLQAALAAQGIRTEAACTLVLLRTGQF